MAGLPGSAATERRTDATFRPARRQRLYEDVVDQILDLVRKGEILPGQRLPSERELEPQLGVSRGVLREAFRVLEARGLVTSRAGEGRFLRDLPSHFGQVGTDFSWLPLRLEQAVILDLWEAREALEAKAAEAAARRATPEDVDKLQRLCDELANDLPFEQVLALDRQFHLAIATAAHNPVLLNMIESMMETFGEVRERVLSGLGRVGGEDRPDDYQAITDAIKSDDAAGAARLILAHLNRTRIKYESR